MKKQFTFFLIMIFVLAACSNGTASLQTVSPSSQDPPESSDVQSPQSSPSRISSSASSQSEVILDELVYYPFVIPDIEHPYADEVTKLVEEFGHDFIFPEFGSLDLLDFTSHSVSSNLYALTSRLNGELLLQGGGVSPEKRDEIIANDSSVYSIIRFRDMNEVGRKYLGKEFSFPKGLICEEIAPLDSDSEYYKWNNPRGELPQKYYLLVEIQEEANNTVATFFPYYLRVDGWFEEETTIVGIDFFSPNYIEKNFFIRAELDYPNITYYNEITDPKIYLEYCLLPVPQEDLGTITVTFQREDTGNLIATSCKYNRK